VALPRGRHFDPGLVDIFLENLDEFMVIAENHSWKGADAMTDTATSDRIPSFDAIRGA
jgi:HD-GYP domain-containing protein (c-di-GMP phosphodiesterase class II)